MQENGLTKMAAILIFQLQFEKGHYKTNIVSKYVFRAVHYKIRRAYVWDTVYVKKPKTC